MYRILLERSAERDLRRLSVRMHERLITAIQGLAANPRPPGCRKLMASKNGWRIRVGDYRDSGCALIRPDAIFDSTFR
jgi:mRNA interferase RelE/StbE